MLMSNALFFFSPRHPSLSLLLFLVVLFMYFFFPSPSNNTTTTTTTVLRYSPPPPPLLLLKLHNLNTRPPTRPRPTAVSMSSGCVEKSAVERGIQSSLPSLTYEAIRALGEDIQAFRHRHQLTGMGGRIDEVRGWCRLAEILFTF